MKKVKLIVWYLIALFFLLSPWWVQYLPKKEKKQVYSTYPSDYEIMMLNQNLEK